jgi:predicted nuclease of predicted toxin-antitoxin system
LKFLIDRCAGRRLAAWLDTSGHDVRTAWEREPDPAAARIALMSDLLARHASDLPGSIVTIRGGRVRISVASGNT